MLGRRKAIIMLTLFYAIMFIVIFMAADGNARSPVKQTVKYYIYKQFKTDGLFAFSVARCESNLNPRATGRAGERGLFQIHPTWFNKSVPGVGVVNANRLYDAEYNIRVAYHIKRNYGWSHWTCARKTSRSLA